MPIVLVSKDGLSCGTVTNISKLQAYFVFIAYEYSSEVLQKPHTLMEMSPGSVFVEQSPQIIRAPRVAKMVFHHP